MTTHLDVAAIGARVRVDFGTDLAPDIADRVRASWADAVIEGAAEPDATVSVKEGRAADAMAEQLTVQVTLAALNHRRGELLMFHAGGVADDDGQVLAYVGPSGRGKTTLSRELGRHYGYVSDETIGVDGALTVLPYRKPLSVVREGAPKEQVSASAFGMRMLPTAPLRLRTLALLDRDPEHAEPHFEPLSYSEAIPELVSQTSFLPELPQPLQALAKLADRTGGFVRLTYSDAASVVPLVPEMLGRSGLREEWRAVPAGGATGRFDDSGVIDAVRVGDRTVVLTQHRVHVLDGVAPGIWDAVRTGRDIDGIVADVIDQYGMPPEGDPRTIVESALDELIAGGVLTLR